MLLTEDSEKYVGVHLQLHPINHTEKSKKLNRHEQTKKDGGEMRLTIFRIFECHFEKLYFTWNKHGIVILSFVYSLVQQQCYQQTTQFLLKT